MTYAEKLRDPRWQKKRLQILDRDGWACQACFDKGSTLNVHHRYYISGRDPWHYPDWSLVTLCEHCHAEVTDSSKTDFRCWEFLVEWFTCGNQRRLSDLFNTVMETRQEENLSNEDTNARVVDAFTFGVVDPLKEEPKE